ncbi:MAG: hypothetical protein JWO67_6731 [Streptosporangiaceae bacterium]|nr:hypothetical protein [Streptosporangiaceae bacterium]
MTMSIQIGPGRAWYGDPDSGEWKYLGETGPMEFGAAPGRYCCLAPDCKHDRAQVFNGGGGDPDVEEPADADGYTCGHCRRGRCAQCTDRACTCCAGYPDPDE